MQVHIVPILKDNYAYIIQTDTDVAIVDPGDAAPVLAYLDEHGLHPNWIINTHRHGDHVDGNVHLKDAFDCKLAAPAECDGDIDTVLSDGDVFSFGNLEFQIIQTKGHTAGHIVLFEPTRKILFSGDTLFVMGCGRVFEGTPDDMFISLKKIKELPPETKIYCGHEYTAANANFAVHILPDNEDVAQARREMLGQKCTVPTLLSRELKTNPFLLANSVSEFAKYRAAKDRF